MPDSPLAIAALIATCLALPFGVAALFDSGPAPTPVAVSTTAIEPLTDENQTAVRIATLASAPRLPTLQKQPETETTTTTTAAAPAAPTPATPAAPTPAPAPAATPRPSSGSSGASGGGSFDSGGSGGGGSSDSFDSTR